MACSPEKAQGAWQPRIDPGRAATGPSAPFPGQSQASADDLLLRRIAANSTPGTTSPSSSNTTASRCRAATTRHLPRQARKPHQEPLGVPAARPVRQIHVGPVASARRACRRHVLHPLDDVEDQHARARRNVHEHRLHRRRLSQRRRMGDVCPGERGRRFAGVSSRFPIRAACRKPGRRTGRTDFCPPCFRARPSTPIGRS